MTIDEAIAHEREVAEEQRKDNDNCKYKSQYGCKDCADYYSKPCIECAKEHEQLAEWLEDYKRIKMLIPIEQALKNEYNKAIDDLLEDANEMAIEVDVDTYTMKAIGIGLLENIAEKLKAGAKNDNLRR